MKKKRIFTGVCLALLLLVGVWAVYWIVQPPVPWIELATNKITLEPTEQEETIVRLECQGVGDSISYLTQIKARKVNNDILVQAYKSTVILGKYLLFIPRPSLEGTYVCRLQKLEAGRYQIYYVNPDFSRVYVGNATL
jgi:hypothetical protein